MLHTLCPAATYAAAGGSGFAVTDLVLNADPIVQGVMALLALTAVVAWAIVCEKVVKLGRARRAARSLETAIKADLLVTGTGKVSAGGLQGAIDRKSTRLNSSH